MSPRLASFLACPFGPSWEWRCSDGAFAGFASQDPGGLVDGVELRVEIDVTRRLTLPDKVPTDPVTGGVAFQHEQLPAVDVSNDIECKRRHVGKSGSVGALGQRNGFLIFDKFNLPIPRIGDHDDSALRESPAFGQWVATCSGNLPVAHHGFAKYRIHASARWPFTGVDETLGDHRGMTIRVVLGQRFRRSVSYTPGPTDADIGSLHSGGGFFDHIRSPLIRIEAQTRHDHRPVRDRYSRRTEPPQLVDLVQSHSVT